jgi:hypothetical protein
VSIRIRLMLHSVAVTLLLVAFAYYWLNETIHELVGTGMFVLVVIHNVLNRRWYGNLTKRRQRGASAIINIAITLSLLVAMLVLLATSLMISRVLFDFLPLDDGATARRIHALAAYWVLVVVSTHLGLRWSMIMNVCRNTFGIATLAIAAFGVYSSFVLGLGSKLMFQVTLDWWDFGESALGFFLHLLSVMGLYVCLIHYTLKWVDVRQRRAQAVPPVDLPRQAGAA